MKNHVDLLQSHMEMLCGTIGPRPTGSANNEAAARYACEVFQKCGFSVEKQEFDCMDWVDSGATLQVDGRNVPVEAAEYSLPCEAEAAFVCLDTVNALQNAQLLGKIAVLHGDLCKEPLMPKNFAFYNPDEHKQIIALLEEKTPAAIVTLIPGNEHVIQDGDFSIPCAVAGAQFLDVFRQNPGGRAKLCINTARKPARAHNVVATCGQAGKKLCFSAHLDTKPNTPGALDNASGVAALLAFAESIAACPAGKDHPFQIEIVLFNGEDYYSNPGEMLFMGGLSPNYALAVNVDGIGLKDSATSVSFYACPGETEDAIIACAQAMPGFERIEPWPMGDHMVFAGCGIPTVAVTASGIFGLLDGVLHSPQDTTQNVDMDILDAVVQFLLEIVARRENGR